MFKNYNDYIIYGNDIMGFVGYNLVGVITSINIDSNYQYVLDYVMDVIYSKTGNKEKIICIQNIYREV